LPAGKSLSGSNGGVGISDGVGSDVKNNSASGRSIDSSSGFGSSSNAVIEGIGLSETVALRNIGDDNNNEGDSSVGDPDGTQTGSDVGAVVSMSSTDSDSSKGSGSGSDSSKGSGSGSDSSKGSGSGSDNSKGSGSGSSDSSKGSGSGSDSSKGSGSGSDSSKGSGSGSDSSVGSGSGSDSSKGSGSGSNSSSSIGNSSDSGSINGGESTTDSSTGTGGGISRGSGAGSEIANSGGSIDTMLTSKVSTNVTSSEGPNMPLAGNSNLRDVPNKSNNSGLITLSDPATNNTSSAPATSPLPTTANPTSKSVGESDTNSEASSTTTGSVSAEPVPQVATIVLLKDEAFIEN
jgi:hypothetical protein